MAILSLCLGTGLDFVVVWFNFQISLVLKFSDEDCLASYMWNGDWPRFQA